jgi:hypothetical protein
MAGDSRQRQLPSEADVQRSTDGIVERQELAGFQTVRWPLRIYD